MFSVVVKYRLLKKIHICSLNLIKKSTVYIVTFDVQIVPETAKLAIL